MPLNRFPWMTLGRRETGAEFFEKCNEQKARVGLLALRPQISIIVPIVGENPEGLQETLQALELQSYSNFKIETPRGNTWQEAFDKGLESCTGEWVGLVSPGDILSPAALFLMVSQFSKTVAPAYYSFEAVVDSKGRTIEKLFRKGELSDFDLRHFNSAGRFWLIKTDLLRSLGGFNSRRTERELFLELVSKKHAVSLLPYYLYYRRNALNLEANKISWPELPANPLVSIVVCFRDKAAQTIECLRSVATQVQKSSIEFVLVNNESSSVDQDQIRSVVESLQIPYQWVDYSRPFNFGHMNNIAAREYCRGTYLFFLNNDVFLTSSSGVIDKLVSWAQFDWVGTVGMLLRYPHGGVQHAGLGARAGGQARLVRLGNLQREDFFTSQNHTVFGNTFAACMVKKTTFLDVGGLPEIELANGFGDVAFNFECLRKGLTNLYLGSIEAVHAESASRGLSYEYWEELSIEREYPEIIQRMLRYDIGLQEGQSLGTEMRSAVREAVNATIREKFPWFVPFKSQARRLLRSVSLSN